MTNEPQIRLLDATARCLRSAAKMLLGAGVTYTQFEDLSKLAFVQAALTDSRGSRSVNTSRVAVKTGLSRKEVARLRTVLDFERISSTTYQIGRPARALQLWHTDPEFIDSNGNPIDLSFDQGEPNFQGLIKRVGGDVPAGAVRAELIAANAVVELPNGKLRAQQRFFVPSDYGNDLIVGLAFIIAPMLETLRHNLESPKEAYIQRVTYSDHLPKDAADEFRMMTHAEAAQLMQKVDAWLATREVDRGNVGDESKRVGLGVYYFETPRNQDK